MSTSLCKLLQPPQGKRFIIFDYSARCRAALKASTLNIVYAVQEDTIVKTYIDEQFENVPKSHVVYKMFSLIEYEVIEIIRFMIEHM